MGKKLIVLFPSEQEEKTPVWQVVAMASHGQAPS